MKIVLRGLAVMIGLACSSKSTYVPMGLSPSDSAALREAPKCDSQPRDRTYIPSVVNIPMPPLPIPKSMYGSSVVGVFLIDERGRITDLRMTPAKDHEYGLRLARVWRSMEFRPGHAMDGTPIKGCFQLVMRF